MPSDSIAGFLDHAQANRVLFPEQVEQLIRQPDIPQSDLSALVQYLEQRGVLSRFQAERLREGRGNELTFAGYPIMDEAGPMYGGTAYRALHPSLRTPVFLCRFRPAALLPDDTPTAFVARAQAATTLHHPNLVTLLDAGLVGDEPYAAVEIPVDAGDLEALVRDIGPMPAVLAAEYGRQAADVLRTAHERGMWHGDVRPATLMAGPLVAKPAADGTIKRRPAPNAAVRVSGLGLVPVRPAAALVTPPLEVIPYLPPERAAAAAYDPRGDIYGLGVTLYYLLTGRPPFAGATAPELLDKLRTTEPAPLTALRPDLPQPLVALVNQMMAKRPDRRPPTAFDVEAGLTPFCRPGTAPPPPSRVNMQPQLVAVPAGEPMPTAEPAEEEGWGGPLAAGDTDSDYTPRARPKRTAGQKAKTQLMVAAGILLHVTAVTILILWLTGYFNSDPEKDKDPKKNPAGQRK